jgi:hypothetical protein
VDADPAKGLHRLGAMGHGTNPALLLPTAAAEAWFGLQRGAAGGAVSSKSTGHIGADRRNGDLPGAAIAE